MASTDSTALREAIIATALRMNALGINRGMAGNVSARIDDGFLITPSALPYDQMRPEDIARVPEGGSASGRLVPSSEWRFHRAIYASRPELEAIVHADSPFATTLACLDRAIPAFHYMVAVVGGSDIRCASYATFGTQPLADEVSRAMDGRRACLLSHHGMIAVVGSLKSALARAVEFETLTEIYWRALQIGEPMILSEQKMRVILDKFTDYGRTGSRVG